MKMFSAKSVYQIFQYIKRMGGLENTNFAATMCVLKYYFYFISTVQLTDKEAIIQLHTQQPGIHRGEKGGALQQCYTIVHSLVLSD